MMPSPIGKPGHAKNPSNITSATSPLLSLTPNSSVDGNSEWTSRQPSPPGDAPAIPFLSSHEHHRRVSSSGDPTAGDLGSVGSHNNNNNSNEPDDDGLLGLGALSDRAQSGVGGYSSSSPPLARGHLPSHGSERGASQRPPLSQSYIEGGSSHGDRSVGERSTGSGGHHFTSNNGFEPTDFRGLGAIARPSGNEFIDLSVRSTGSGENGFGLPNNGGVFEQGQISQKFGTLPSLGSHIQQQRGGFISGHDMAKPRNIRSVSVQNPPATVHMDPRLYGQQHMGMPQRSQSIAVSYDGAHYANHKRNSLPSFSNSPTGYEQVHPHLDRRNALEFPHNGVPDDVRIHGSGSMISPGQSPQMHHYPASVGGHSRTPSFENAPPILSASPGSSVLRSSGVMQQQQHHHMRQSQMGEVEDSHPLVGDTIEIPPEHHYQDQSFLGGQQNVGMIRARGHGHSSSLGDLPSHYMDQGIHLPSAGSNGAFPLPKVVYSVKFKRTQRNFVLGPRISRDLKVGTYVKVEADRGEDLGIVVGKVPADKFNFASRTQYTAGMGPPGGMGGTSAADLKRIIRLATHDEVSLLGVKREEEEELLKICRGKVRQRGLPMNVVDAEYQFDRHKLTFFFEAEGRVDFRELVRDLFSMYKTRIWMQQLDKNTSTSSPAIVAPQQHLQMDYGTPIIAPASEFADSLPMAGMGEARMY